MLCPSCGKEVAKTDARCDSCGGSLFVNRRVSLESQSTAGSAAPVREFARVPNASGKVAPGLVLGVVGLLVVLIVVIPNVFRVRLPTGPGPVSMLRTINTAEITYSTTYDYGFSPTLAALGCPKDATSANFKPSEKEAGLIDPILAAGTIVCYRFSYIPRPVDSSGKISTYMVHADPAEPCAHSKMHYFTDQTRVIRSEKDMEAYASSPPIIE